MGWWRDIGSSLGVCDQRTPEEVEREEKDHAANRTRHERGCRRSDSPYRGSKCE